MSQERDELEREVESLHRAVRQLRLEQDLLNKANELLKKGLSVDLQLLTNREKTLLIDALRKHYGLPKLLAQLGLARSSYFYHRTRAAVGDKYVQVRQFITEIFESNLAAIATAGCRPRSPDRTSRSRRRSCSD